MKKSFHNTTNEVEQLEMFEGMANTQEEIILQMYKDRKRMSASDVFNFYPCGVTPITSIRRAITNLYKDGKLLKTEDKKQGIY